MSPSDQRKSFWPMWPTGGHLTERGWPSWSSTTAWCPTWLYLASPAWRTPKESSTRTPRWETDGTVHIILTSVLSYDDSQKQINLQSSFIILKLWSPRCDTVWGGWGVFTWICRHSIIRMSRLTECKCLFLSHCDLHLLQWSVSSMFNQRHFIIHLFCTSEKKNVCIVSSTFVQTCAF